MDVKSESWQWLPKSHGRQSRQGGTSPHYRTPEWRRSGDESYWQGLVAQVDRPPRAARPQSCIEGRLMDDWLETLEKLQTHPVQQQVPAFADRTTSMPSLPNKTGTGPPPFPSHSYLQKREWTPSVSPSLDNSSLDSVDSLETLSGLDTKEKARIKTAPSAQKAKLCRLAPVRIGWLPLQRHVIMNDGTNSARGNSSQVKLKPPITPVLSSSFVKTQGPQPGDRPAERSGAGVPSGVQRPWRISGHNLPEAAPVEGDQNTAHDPTSRGQMPHFQDRQLQPKGLMWTTPVQRRGSIPQSSPTNGSPSPKHSSSISSITITSRRVVRSSSLPNTSLPPQPGGNVSSHHQTEPSKHSKPFIPQRRALLVKVTEQSSRSSTVLQPNDKTSHVNARSSNLTTGERLTTRLTPKLTSTENHSPPARCIFAPGISRTVPSNLGTVETHEPVVLRRKATIVKVEHRESYRSESQGKMEHRHSYTEGFRATSSLTYTSNPSYTKTEPLQANKARLTESEAQKSNEKVKEVHTSTLSFQLSCPSSNRPPLDNPQGTKFRRPASCYASIFSPSEPSKDSGFQSTGSVLPQKTNIDPQSFPGSSSNRRWSTGGEARSRDEIYPGRESSAGDVAQKQRGSALLGNLQPFTLIRMPESTAHITHDATLALNAAAVIANIKRQSQQRKGVHTLSRAEGKMDSSSQSKTAESSKGDEVCNGERHVEESLPTKIETAVFVKHGHAEFVPPQTTDRPSPNIHTLSNALEQSRPDFIRRSQARVKAMKQRARARQKRNTTTPTAAKRQSDTTFKSPDRNISAKQQQPQFRCHSSLQEVKKRKEEEKRKLDSQTNRQRLELFTKKILEQVLHRGKD